jgi:hypothetical protein
MCQFILFDSLHFFIHGNHLFVHGSGGSARLFAPKEIDLAIDTRFATIVVDRMFKIMVNALTKNPIIQANPVATPPPEKKPPFEAHLWDVRMKNAPIFSEAPTQNYQYLIVNNKLFS